MGVIDFAAQGRDIANFGSRCGRGWQQISRCRGRREPSSPIPVPSPAKRRQGGSDGGGGSSSVLTAGSWPGGACAARPACHAGIWKASIPRPLSPRCRERGEDRDLPGFVTRQQKGLSAHEVCVQRTIWRGGLVLYSPWPPFPHGVGKEGDRESEAVDERVSGDPVMSGVAEGRRKERRKTRRCEEAKMLARGPVQAPAAGGTIRYI